MKVIRIFRFALVLALGIALLSSSITVAQDSAPESIYRAAYKAFNEGDVDGGMANPSHLTRNLDLRRSR